MNKELANLIINHGLDAGTDWEVLNDGNIKIRWDDGKTYIIKAEEVEEKNENEMITLVAHNEENGEVMSVMAPRKKAINAITEAYLSRGDFRASHRVAFYFDTELRTPVDASTMNEISEIIMGVK